jgi:hypothetical protein
VEVKRAAELYAQGWSLRQIGAELGVRWTAVNDQLHRAGVTMRRGGPPAHPASTQKIMELRDQGLTWTEVAKQVDMTVFWRMEPLPEGQTAKTAAPGQMATGFRQRA